jgi:uncharacterized protein (TIGR02145 family)
MDLNKNNLEALEKLGSLFKSGALSKEEFETLKKELLGKPIKNQGEMKQEEFQITKIESSYKGDIKEESAIDKSNDVNDNNIDAEPKYVKNNLNPDFKIHDVEEEARKSTLSNLPSENHSSNKNLTLALGCVLLLVLGLVFWFRYGESGPTAEEVAQKDKFIRDSIALAESNLMKNSDDSIRNTDYENEENSNIILDDNLDDFEIKSIQVGNQTWMNRNLNVTQFRNGDSIPQAKNFEDWERFLSMSEAAWCYSEFDSKNGNIGKIYNWYAVFDSRGLAPLGWKVPREEDWKELSMFFFSSDNSNVIIKKNISDKPKEIILETELKANGFNLIKGYSISYLSSYDFSFQAWWSSTTSYYLIKGSDWKNYVASGRTWYMKDTIIGHEGYISDELIGLKEGAYVICVGE